MKAFLNYVCEITNNDQSTIISYVDYTRINQNKFVIIKSDDRVLGIIIDKLRLSSFGGSIKYTHKLIGNDFYSFFCIDRFRNYFHQFCRFI